jgi:hypothetical protein
VEAAAVCAGRQRLLFKGVRNAASITLPQHCIPEYLAALYQSRA